MCGIVASFDPKKLIKLFELNESRGGAAWSVARIDPVMLTVKVDQFEGPVDYEYLKKLKKGCYFVGHTQAPTNGLNGTSGTHPAQFDRYHLFHNGILKSDYLKKLKKDLGVDSNWDTEVLLRKVTKSGRFKCRELNDVQGSFACVLLEPDNMPRVFRNQTSPLFMTEGLDLSSVPFQGAFPLMPGELYSFNLFDKEYILTDDFDNIDTPFFFAGE